MPCLSGAQIASVRSLLERLCIPSSAANANDKDDCVVGEILVANIYRSITAGIHDVELTASILNYWATRLISLDADNAAAGYATNVAEILALTETEAFATSVKPLHALLADASYNTFKAAASGFSFFHVKTLHATLDYLFYGAADAIGLSDNTVPGTEQRTAELVKARLSQLRQDQLKSKRGAACLHNKQYIWASSRQQLEGMLGKSFSGDPPNLDLWVADRVAELLGLVHLTKPPTAKTGANHRFLVGIEPSPTYFREVTKSSFVFSDHNPRFASWDDDEAVANRDWGSGVDLAVFDSLQKLQKGAVEALVVVPTTLNRSDIHAMHALGRLTINSWGVEAQVCANNLSFSSNLRGPMKSTEIVDMIVKSIQTGAT